MVVKVGMRILLSTVAYQQDEMGKGKTVYPQRTISTKKTAANEKTNLKSQLTTK